LAANFANFANFRTDQERHGMAKTFMGVKLRKLRSERGMSQIALAHALGISPSYLNQVEQNQRPLTVSLLLKLNRALGVDIQQFSEDEEARLIAALREALADAPEPISLPELQEVATQMPALGRAIVALYRRNLDAAAQLEAMAVRMGDGRTDAAPAAPASRATAFEAVRDFFFAHQNHFDALDRAAEALAEQAGLEGAALAPWLAQRLAEQHQVRMVVSDGGEEGKRLFDPRSRTLRLSRALDAGQQAFQMATQLALLEAGPLMEGLTRAAPFAGDVATVQLARIGLANYFAGALLLPYGPFLRAAETLRHDIDLLGQRFAVGFETVCHRLSTLQRSTDPGVPFFFVRVDRKHLQAPVGHALPLQPHRRHVPAVECLRSVCAARARASTTGAHARWPDLPLDCAHGDKRPIARLRRTRQDVLHRPGLRCAPRASPGVRQGAGPGRPRHSHSDRNGLQGVRTPGMPATRVSVCGQSLGRE
jgi:transcriptional regulator with XRE-family HTH domain